MAERSSNFKDKVGNRYGRLLVVAFAGVQVTPGRKKANHKSAWLCRCDCGNEKVYLAGSLSTARTKSCGCLARETTAAFNRKHKTKVAYDTFSCVWNSYKSGATKRGYPFELTKDQFYWLTQQNCYYCDSPPSQKRAARLKSKTTTYIFGGIDRKDNNSGYFPENCVPCCCTCNRMKRDTPFDAFIAKIASIFHIHGKL